jgi:hypothetical protein
VSATVVELKRMLRGAVPVVESTVSQMGRLEVSTEKNGAGEAEDVMLTSTRPADPDPLTYVREAGLGVAVSGVGATI